MPCRILVLGLALALGSACTRDNPLYCAAADECAVGSACDLATNTCVEAALTLDPAPFFVATDGRWWSPTTGPELHGTLSDPNGPIVQAYVGGVPAGEPATVSDRAWALVLPEGALSIDGTAVEVRLSGSGDQASLTQIFVGDPDPAVATIAAGASIRDERDDAITFTPAGPVHDHQGAAVALGTGCPDVYKHAYLMDPSPPAFGTEIAPNPLQWPVDVADAATPAPDAVSIRLRWQAGATLLDWTPVATAGLQQAPGVRRHAIDLVRSGPTGAPGLGTDEGAIELDVRATDWAGRETETTTCWTHHPLAPPVQVGAVNTGIPDSLLSWLLPSASIVSLIQGTGDGALFELAITQYTAEPITVEIGVASPYVLRDIAWVSDSVQTGTTAVSVQCGFECEPPGPGCTDTFPLVPLCDGSDAAPLPPAANLTGQVLTLEWGVTMRRTSGGDIACTGSPARCVIPGRAASDTLPVGYVVVPRLVNAPLTPDGGTAYNVHTLLGQDFIGRILDTFYGCSQFDVTITGNHVNYRCINRTTNTQFQGLDRWRLNNIQILGPLELSLGTTVSETASVRTLPGSWTHGGWTWDAGNADLPGPTY